MEIIINRSYHSAGTNGVLLLNKKVFCNTIELPWKHNQPMVSCIPEGRYLLSKRHSTRFDWHLLVMDVPNRDLILIHPFNNALEESNGCIGPVSTIAAPGEGQKSRIAFLRLRSKVYAAIQNNQLVYLTIQSMNNETENT